SAAALRCRRRGGAVPQLPPREKTDRVPVLYHWPHSRTAGPGAGAARAAGAGAGGGGGGTRRGGSGGAAGEGGGRGINSGRWRGGAGGGSAEPGRVRTVERIGPRRHGYRLPRLAAVASAAGGGQEAAAGRRRADRGSVSEGDPRPGPRGAPQPGE